MSGTDGAPSSPRTPPAGVLDRSLSVLNCFSGDAPRLHLREIAGLTGLDKATLLRMLGTFMAHNYIQRLEDGRYAPGPAVLRLASVYNAVSDTGLRMTAVLRRLVEETGESAAFYTRSGDDRVCVARVNSSRAVRYQVEIGHGVPLKDGGAAAHVILAYHGGHSKRSAEVLAQGYVTTAAERDSELASVAIPVFEADGTFLGALVVSSPISRQSDEAWARARTIAAMELQARGFGTAGPSDQALRRLAPALQDL